MRYEEFFPSKFLKAADLTNGIMRATIVRVETIQLAKDEGPKPVIFLKNVDKGLVCNKTNFKKIASAYGDDTDDWLGKQIELYVAEVEYQGQTVPGIRVRKPTSPPVKQTAQHIEADPTQVDPL